MNTEEMTATDISALHVPVLLEETLSALAPVAEGRYLDGTLGLGGHASAILRRATESQICGLDRDGSALEMARKRLDEYGNRAHCFHMAFDNFPDALNELGWKQIDGALLDLGISSLQIDNHERGFSFLCDGPLDMRMDASGMGKTAERLVNRLSFDELKRIFAEYGEEPLAGRIARRIVEERQKEPILTTGRLAAAVCSAYPVAMRKKSRKHPATRAFQALRMVVNDEFGQLERFMDKILPWIAPGGRVVVISFHSIEDRLVKNTMKRWASGCLCPRQIPVCVCGHKPEARILYKKPLTATEAELDMNPRASSAKLRAAEKLPGTEI